MSFIIAVIMWIYSWESRPEVKPWPSKDNKHKYEALFAEFAKTQSGKRKKIE